MAQPPGIHARRAALKLLDAVLRRGETLEQSTNAALRDVRSEPDRALARAIAGETLRWLVDIDTLIDSATRQPLPSDAKARSVLRMMLAQALRLETPPHAVIATGLPLLSGGPRRLAHGVFGTLTKKQVCLPDIPTLPSAVCERWGDVSGEIAAGLVDPPELDLAIKTAANASDYANQMGGITLASGHVRLPRGTSVVELPGYADGEWWVQDLAAQLPVRLLGQGDQRHALDLCAAPGGKTMGLAAAGWNVTALDISKRRLDLIKTNLKRTKLRASPVRADALTWEPKHHFDAILLDAPCTATGTCRRHPDVLHRIGRHQIEEMAELQRALIERAIAWLKPGGLLVYATCSLEREEGEEQASWIDETFDLTPLPISPDEPPAAIEPTLEGWLRTHPGMLPHEGGLDGFFAARFVLPA